MLYLSVMLFWSSFFFFFFKQKTAYEMRISDWSSDVCSSDLRPARAMRHRAEYMAMRIDRAGRRNKSRFRGIRKIGRASCRERVCPVRVDLGGRRIINKKKQY